GTSARNASGSDSRNANSDAARTSRASEPIATPSAANASEPPASASTHSPERPQSSGTNALTPTSIASDTANAHAADRTTFSVMSWEPGTSPRASRENVSPSRSSASSPDASRTQTNISDT